MTNIAHSCAPIQRHAKPPSRRRTGYCIFAHTHTHTGTQSLTHTRNEKCYFKAKCRQHLQHIWPTVPAVGLLCPSATCGMRGTAELCSAGCAPPAPWLLPACSAASHFIHFGCIAHTFSHAKRNCNRARVKGPKPAPRCASCLACPGLPCSYSLPALGS